MTIYELFESGNLRVRVPKWTPEAYVLLGCSQVGDKRFIQPTATLIDPRSIAAFQSDPQPGEEEFCRPLKQLVAMLSVTYAEWEPYLGEPSEWERE